MRWWRLVAIALSLLWETTALAQVVVVPRRAGQTMVRYHSHDWQTLTLLEGEEVDGREAGGIRLFFDGDEAGTAEWAVPHLTRSYRELAATFDHTPKRRFDYVLYSSYQEFTRTNLFPIQEGILGVTSLTSPHVTSPYLGDHRTFRDVSKHELAHAFTLSKVRLRAREEKVPDPLGALPLWFVEGLAEYYAQDGELTPDAAQTVADLLVNPDVWRGRGLPELFEDRPWSAAATYHVGLARVVFLQETYGDDVVQSILSRSPELSRSQPLEGRRFERLVAAVTGEAPGAMQRRYAEWVRRRAYGSWLDTTGHADAIVVPEELPEHVDALAASPDGTLLLLRLVEISRRSLVLVDPRAPARSRRVASEGRPGVESLHVLDRRPFDLGEDELVMVVESRGHDDIVWRSVEREVSTPTAELPLREELPSAEVRLRVGRRERHRLRKHGLISAWSPSLSPDGERVAFVGMGRSGVRDVYVLTRAGELTRLTEDPWAEHQVSWGPDGVSYTADATEDGSLDLFRVDADGGTPERLTWHDADVRDPVAVDAGTLFTSWRGPWSQLHLLTGDGVTRRSDLPAAMLTPAPGPPGASWVLLQEAGRRRPALLRDPDHDEVVAQSPAGEGPAVSPPRVEVGGSRRYHPEHPRNWSLDGGWFQVTGGYGGIWGDVALSGSDRLRDHGFVAWATFLGRADYVDTAFFYTSERRRVAWGGGPFHAMRLRIDRTFDDGPLFQSWERYYGVSTVFRYPFGRFTWIQADPTVGLSRPFLTKGTASCLADPACSGTESDLAAKWTALGTRPRPQLELRLRLGYDTVRPHPIAGPVAGTSALLELFGGMQPTEGEHYATVRVDLTQYVPLGQAANIRLRGTGGSSFGGRFAQSFWLSTYDTLRGVRPYDLDHTLGLHFVCTNAELEVPLDAVVRTAFSSSLQGVFGIDAGAIAEDPATLWDRRILDVAVGGNVLLGPIVLRIHFARPLYIGGERLDPEWVTNVSLGWTAL